MQARAPLDRRPPERSPSTRDDSDESTYQARVLDAIEQGLADVRAGNIVDDDELARQLDQEFGPLT